MVVPRTFGRWACQWANRTARPMRSTTRSNVSQQASRRGYASQGPHHGTHRSGSDLPWAIGSLAFTIPSVAYLIQPQLKSGHDDEHGHGHGEGHDPEDKGGPIEDSEPGDLVPNLRKKDSGEEDAEGAEGGDENSNQENGEDKSEDQSDDSSKEEDKSEDQSDDSNSESEGGKQEETPQSADDEESKNTAHVTDSGENVEGVQFKGATSGGSREGEQGDTRKHIPDAKGGNKKRIESDYGNPLGVEGDESSRTNTEKAASSKTPGGQTTSQSGRQAGLSNTDTKHSTDIANDADKSKKGEGAPETAKLQGTVDPNRPQAENRQRSE